jgi:CubicO group peptidase (beta-lactamase class C family)
MKARLVTTVILFTFVIGSPNSALAQTSNRDKSDSKDKKLAERIKSFEAHFDGPDHLSGVLLIARGDKVILHKAYGKAHVGLGVANDVHTRIGIASITKMMTNLLLMQLIGEGKFALDTPIAKWLPDFPKGDKITIGLLTRHRAGIPHRVTTAAEECLPLSSQDIVDRAAKAPLLFEPGTDFSYSSTGYSVLARCMELATGETYAHLIKTRVFEPAGMQDSFDSPPGGEIRRHASYYVPGREQLWPAPKKDFAFLVGAGSIISTAEDLWRYVQALRANKLGVPFDALAKNGRIAWTGASGGCFAFVDTHPDDRLTCIWLGNSWGGCASALRSALPALCRGDKTDPPERPELVSTPSEAELAEYLGRYKTGFGAWYESRITNAELWLADSMVLAIGKDTFWYPPMNSSLVFVRDGKGKVVAVECRNAASVERWPRDAGRS